MTDSIEETWEALDKLPRVLTEHEYHHRQRALALAVLEEAVFSANATLKLIGEDAIFDGHKLRARIQALGVKP